MQAGATQAKFQDGQVLKGAQGRTVGDGGVLQPPAQRPAATRIRAGCRWAKGSQFMVRVAERPCWWPQGEGVQAGLLAEDWCGTGRAGSIVRGHMPRLIAAALKNPCRKAGTSAQRPLAAAPARAPPGIRYSRRESSRPVKANALLMPSE